MSSILLRDKTTPIINKNDFPDVQLGLIAGYKNEMNVDIFLDEIVKQNLTESNYDNILIPLCFGTAFSDFLGLRLALHIRTNASSNNFKNIFIYGFEKFENLLSNEFFPVLNFAGVNLIDFNYKNLTKALSTKEIFSDTTQLRKDLSHFKLNVPSNFYNNHSIANYWGIFNLCMLENIKIEDIETFKENTLKDIYFKWMVAKNRHIDIIDQKVTEAKLNYSEQFKVIKDQLSGPKKIIDLEKLKKKI